MSRWCRSTMMLIPLHIWMIQLKKIWQILFLEGVSGTQSSEKQKKNGKKSLKLIPGTGHSWRLFETHPSWSHLQRKFANNQGMALETEYNHEISDFRLEWRMGMSAPFPIPKIILVFSTLLKLLKGKDSRWFLWCHLTFHHTLVLFPETAKVAVVILMGSVATIKNGHWLTQCTVIHYRHCCIENIKHSSGKLWRIRDY